MTAGQRDGHPRPRGRASGRAGSLRSAWTGPAIADAAAFLVGGWLLAAPFALHYPTLAMGFPGRWNDILVGGAVAVHAAVRQLPWLTARFPWPRLLLGTWLMIAPLVLRYPETASSATPVVNDIALGAALVALAAAVDAHGERGDAGRFRDRGGARAGGDAGRDPHSSAGTGTTGL